MSLDSLKIIIAAEKEADNKLATVYLEAKRIIAEAEADGHQFIMTAEAEAEKSVENLRAEGEVKAAEAVRDIAVRTSLTCQSLRSTAQRNMPQAIRLVVERIVNLWP